MAVILYVIKDIPLLVDAAWLDAVGSGLLLFLISGAMPLFALVIGWLGERARGIAIRMHYVLTIVIGAALAYGAYMPGLDMP